jgi:hypothetical protein
MPIRIESHKNGKRSELAWLCDDDWQLPQQVEALREWLEQNAETLPPGEYSADIGFAPRPDAAGGGGEITLEMMRSMLAIGMTLYLSEYPEMETDSEEDDT